MGKTVWIKCKMVVEYNQQVNLTDEEYETIEQALQEDDCIEEGTIISYKSAYGILEGRLDHKSVYDTEHEYTDVQMELESEYEEEDDK